MRSSSDHEVTAVIIAAAQSVAKVFCIGAVGWTATRFPKARPLLPFNAVPTVARFSFHALTLALIYSTTARSVNLDSLMGDYWFLVAGAWGVLALSYATATGLGYCGRIVSRRNNGNNSNADFRALRIAATFPNIVALPILIFPSLCEFEVVYRGYYNATTTAGGDDYDDDDGATSAQQVDASQLQERCEIESNTMIFCYFFSWSLAFWIFGYPQLMAAATAKQSSNNPSSHDTSSSSRSSDEASTTSEERGVAEVLPASSTRSNNDNDDDDDVDQDARTRQQQDPICAGSPSSLSPTPPPPPVEATDDDDDMTSTAMAVAAECQSTAPPPSRLLFQSSPSWCRRLPACGARIAAALRQTLSSPGFLALFAGVLTGCVPPLQRELFEPAGALRFLGDALETLGSASSPMSTLVVAASLVPAAAAAATTPQSGDDGNEEDSSNSGDEENDQYDDDGEEAKEEQEGNLEDNPNFGPARRRRQRTRAAAGARIRRLSRTVQRGSARMLKSFRTSEAASSPQRRRDMRRLLCWFILSRLVVAPALVVATIVGLECSGDGGGLLTGVPQLAKLVVIVNSCLPGALIVVVLLKSNPSLSDSATAVAQVYLPSYLLSIVTIAAWTAVGLYITLPDEDGNTFCHQY